ncbi:MAG: hypothetical protein WD845_03975 [Pirellulales bacterium]
MRAGTTILSWISIGLVSLPMSPCALLPSVCVLAEESASAAPADAARVVAHSCCASPMEADSTKTPAPAKPASCPLECCRLSPVGLTVEKVLTAPPTLLTAYVPYALADVGGCYLLPAQELLLPAQTLQALSCLWRC